MPPPYRDVTLSPNPPKLDLHHSFTDKDRAVRQLAVGISLFDKPFKDSILDL